MNAHKNHTVCSKSANTASQLVVPPIVPDGNYPLWIAVNSADDILLVDHEQETLDGLRQHLAAQGQRLNVARSGDEVSKKVRLGYTGIFICNGYLIDETGWLVAAKVRLVNRKVPILIYKPQPCADDQLWKPLLDPFWLVYHNHDLGILQRALTGHIQRLRGPHKHVCAH